jgi:hypothetical protein
LIEQRELLSDDLTARAPLLCHEITVNLGHLQKPTKHLRRIHGLIELLVGERDGQEHLPGGPQRAVGLSERCFEMAKRVCWLPRIKRCLPKLVVLRDFRRFRMRLVRRPHNDAAD